MKGLSTIFKFAVLLYRPVTHAVHISDYVVLLCCKATGKIAHRLNTVSDRFALE